MQQNQTIGTILLPDGDCLPLLHLSQEISIKKCLELLKDNEFKTIELVRFLEKNGETINTEVLSSFPQNFPKPRRSKEYYCHSNTLLYTYQLMNHFKGDDSRLKFVTGMYRLSAISDKVPSTQKYIIGHHSFLTYDGKILDPTIMCNPLTYYKVDDYFGIVHEPRKILKILRKKAMSILINNISPIFYLGK
jgi:hypothetical protein